MPYIPGNPPIPASSVTINQNLLMTMAFNLLGSSGTLNASSALSYANQLRSASSAIETLVGQMKAGIQVSS